MKLLLLTISSIWVTEKKHLLLRLLPLWRWKKRGDRPEMDDEVGAPVLGRVPGKWMGKKRVRFGRWMKCGSGGCEVFGRWKGVGFNGCEVSTSGFAPAMAPSLCSHPLSSSLLSSLPLLPTPPTHQHHHHHLHLPSNPTLFHQLFIVKPLLIHLSNPSKLPNPFPNPFILQRPHSHRTQNWCTERQLSARVSIFWTIQIFKMCA